MDTASLRTALPLFIVVNVHTYNPSTPLHSTPKHLDGQFTGHKYWGDRICIELSRDVIRAFIAKLCVLPQVCPPPYQFNLNLLHPDCLIDLLPLLLDFLTIDIELAMRLTEMRDMTVYTDTETNPTTGLITTSPSSYYDSHKNLFNLDAKVNHAKGRLIKPEYIVVDGSSLETQRQQAQYLIEKFNLWTSKQNDMVCTNQTCILYM